MLTPKNSKGHRSLQKAADLRSEEYRRIGIIGVLYLQVDGQAGERRNAYLAVEKLKKDDAQSLKMADDDD